MHLSRSFLARATAVLLLTPSLGCGGRTPPPGGARSGPPGAAAGGPNAATSRATPGITFDASPLYRQMGMIARGLPFPLVGRAAFAAGPSADSTHVVVALTFSNAALAFARE